MLVDITATQVAAAFRTSHSDRKQQKQVKKVKIFSFFMFLILTFIKKLRVWQMEMDEGIPHPSDGFYCPPMYEGFSCPLFGWTREYLGGIPRLLFGKCP